MSNESSQFARMVREAPASHPIERLLSAARQVVDEAKPHAQHPEAAVVVPLYFIQVLEKALLDFTGSNDYAGDVPYYPI